MADNKKDEKKKAKERVPTAKKRDLQGEKRAVRNRAFKSTLRKKVRTLKEAVEKKDKESLGPILNEVYSLIDKGVKKGIYKKNTANRSKSRLAASALKVTA